MGNTQTKLYYYLTGALIVFILLLRRFLNTYQSFTTVVLCSLMMFLLLVSLFYYGVVQTVHKTILSRPWSRLALLCCGVYLFVLLVPLGLFGFSNFIKFSVPISGAQFTWLTVNRYPIAISAIIGYFGLALVGIYFSNYARNILAVDGDQPVQAFKNTAKSMTMKQFGQKLILVLSMLIGICLFIVGLGFLNKIFPSSGLFFLSQGLIDIVAPFVEIVVIGWLLGVKYAWITSRGLIAGVGVCLIVFSGLLAGINLALSARPIGQPTIIVHRGVINHNAQGNTITALKRNSRYHFPFIEMDIQETKDHQFICAHDDDVTIPSHGKREINQLNLATISQFHHVDMFGDYLRVANRLGQPLIIELKVTDHSDPQMGTRFARQFKRQLQVLPHRVHSVGYPFLRQIKRQLPHTDVGLVTMLNFCNIGNYKVDFYTLQHLTANPFLIASVGKTGRAVYSWTDDSRLSMTRMDLLGVSGQVTDQALRLQELRVNYQKDRWILLLNSLQNYL
ncbi:glycerophosphodiester phosphodiesterase family protein [Lentilactobacillus parakefiri]|uniref:Glycerophosphodiester phosphodiesterase n=1 Tax=Lentilactobacillus parakefiri TaxID=152332 RepID=A0A269Y5I8_9LACO|nr:glycerophosphodiester phosphodiesterase family protein [Lentilactobacillus parakefiri]PAK79916.1 glycerophosphodiester phosphodiesterase [Lentilactobacillus parakefiri]